MDGRQLAEAIKYNVDALTVAQSYGFQPNNAGFICCPFHNEKTPSLKLYKGTKGFSCYGCGTYGSVIDFVEKLFNLSFVEACRKINCDFNLCLPLDREPTLREQKKAREAIRARKEKAKTIEETECKYWSAMQTYVDAQRIIDELAPNDYDDDFPEDWTNAIKNIATYRAELEVAEILWRKAQSQA
jgi:DNA primase